MKNIVQPVKGTRDFYPEQMAFRQWLYGIIRKVSEKYGYQEFEGPEIEPIDLYAEKTSQEILKEQVFSLKDRDGRILVLRPEITPTFARMVAQRSEELQTPIRWYCFGRGWRYEKPQRGRGREFFQWEINILGPETPEADAEILAIAADFFKELGLTPDEVVIRVNDRSYFNQILTENNVSQDKFLTILRIVDRKEKVKPNEFDRLLLNEGLIKKQINSINKFFQKKDYSKSKWLAQVFSSLENYPGVLDYIVYDPTIARGFDYYTRTVFEAWDKSGGLNRSLFGGGRFDNLTETIGGKRMPGVGMAPGDMPIEIVLEQFNKLPSLKIQTARVLVTVFNDQLKGASQKISSILRSNGVNTECWMEGNTKLEKQLKYADKKAIPYVAIVGPVEASANKVIIKNLSNRSQQLVSIDDMVAVVQK